jgi:hypothetical protein
MSANHDSKRAELADLSKAVRAISPDMIERVARSLRVAYCSPGFPVTAWDEQSEMARGEWLEQAAATIAALSLDDLRALLAAKQDGLAHGPPV